MPDVRRIFIATPDEARATTLGDLVTRAGFAEGWQWWTTPGELAVAVFDGGSPIAAIFDHLGRSETLGAVKIIRSIDLRVPIIIAYNGDHPENPTAYDRERFVSAWIPRPVLLRELVHVLALFRRP